MAFLRLRDRRDDRQLEFDDAEVVRIGRDPSFELAIEGAGSEVVSGTHAQLLFRDNAWWVEDMGGRNGTFIDGAQITPSVPVRLDVGKEIGLGRKGPRFVVEAVTSRVIAETVAEPAPRPPTAVEPREDLDRTAPMDEVPPAPPVPRAAEPPTLSVTLRHTKSDNTFSARGGRVRLGRGRECELRPVEAGDAAVSRVHAEIVLKPDGRVILRDAQSRNGTLLNGKRIDGERQLAEGDRIQLGDAGPELKVEALSGPTVVARKPAASPPKVEPPAPKPASPPPAAAAAGGDGPRRSFAGKGRTVFFKELIQETEKKSRDRVRMIVWSFVILLAGAAAGLWWIGERRVRGTEAALEEQRRVAGQEVARLSAEVQSAGERTAQLENALARSQEAINAQLASGDSLQSAAQGEIDRLRRQLTARENDNSSERVIDSIRTAMLAAEQRAAELEAGLRAVRGVDLAQLAERNQAAVGLVTTFAGDGAYDGSGFVVTASGYLVTNRHVARPEGHDPDSVWVTMADQRVPLRADVVAAAPPNGPDLAVLRLRGYQGRHVAAVDWRGNAARQGEPAALIGFPTGIAAALDATGTVRTSMSGGYFSKVTADMIQFDGFTVPGSSGSPIFNASGTVVAVHARGLREGPGLAFTVPIRLLLPLLPADARRELGL